MPRYRYSTKRAKREPRAVSPCETSCRYSPPALSAERRAGGAQAAGVDINALTDKSKTLTERLQPLKTVLDDTALFTKLFGRENSNAAMALVQGIDEVNRYTDVISGTNTAFEQAGIIMESYNEKKARIQARFDDFRISIFNATGDFGIWVETVAGSLVPLSQLMPLIMGVGKAMTLVKSINFAGVFSSLSRVVTAARYQLLFMNAELRTGQMVSIGFLGNITRATAAVVRFATVGLLSGIKALGGVGALPCHGRTRRASRHRFGSFATSRSRRYRRAGLWVSAIMNIPIIGWIAAAIAGLSHWALFWISSAKFRAVLKGLGAAFVATFKGIWNLAKNVFGSIGDLIKAAFSLDGKGIKEAIKSAERRVHGVRQQRRQGIQ